MHTRDWFAYFLWNVKRPAFPESEVEILAEAERLYVESLDDLERWGWAPAPKKELGVWPHAFKIYLHFALFLCLMRSGYKPGTENRNLNKGVLELLKQQVEKLILALPCAHPKITRMHQESKQFNKLPKYLRTYRNLTRDGTFDVLERELLGAWKNLGDTRLPKTAEVDN
ncbi:MAG: hypothetical protein HY237_02695 [Acidobacteria bacterium]|nr:hypothetical protein [Acidobacteriota bacterium]